MAGAPRILTVIPARGGSKGLPGKNVMPLGGLPLIGYPARLAQATQGLQDVILSTDDAAIAEVGRSLGIDVPFLRPSDLATDQASSVAMARHAIDAMEQRIGQPYDALLLLQPTCPFTTPAQLAKALALFASGRYRFVGSMAEVVDQHPAYLLARDDDGGVSRAFPEMQREGPRQELQRFFMRTGNIYLTARDSLMSEGRFIVDPATYVEVDRISAVNINDRLDFLVAEAVAAERAR
ncbi:hypothetical protein GCM10007036_15590 [Alsobacter metallidurans]|uniref:N-acylneuraminate cytidylyltransferase n=1 Tax=Alsobacter metallidurans TaxID=340221 RepID=A0A917I6T7_9HYPH|nr:acylneuraminate cytidylyltransferase family protein [Alsobacter metallidurans]GGH15524.1 hypothetical protein GCM10007036_15590 [Alsobacter metallidurans]